MSHFEIYTSLTENPKWGALSVEEKLAVIYDGLTKAINETDRSFLTSFLKDKKLKKVWVMTTPKFLRDR